MRYADRVKEASTTAGLTDFVLDGEATDGSGFQTFLSTVGDGNTCYYLIESAASNQWETGLGTIDSVGPTLERTTVFDGSSGVSTKVVFAIGSKIVNLSAVAE